MFEKSDLNLVFNETLIGTFSTLDYFSESVSHAINRTGSNSIAKHRVKIISLMDLLHFYQSPKSIDYLRLDTESSEFLILKNFNFISIKFLSVDHNYTENRSKICNSLNLNKFRRVHPEFSGIDD